MQRNLKFLHMTDLFSTGTACDACDKYEVCIIAIIKITIVVIIIKDEQMWNMQQDILSSQGFPIPQEIHCPWATQCMEITGLGKCLDLKLKWEGINFTLGRGPAVQRRYNEITTQQLEALLAPCPVSGAKLRCLSPLSAALWRPFSCSSKNVPDLSVAGVWERWTI